MFVYQCDNCGKSYFIEFIVLNDIDTSYHFCSVQCINEFVDQNNKRKKRKGYNKKERASL